MSSGLVRSRRRDASWVCGLVLCAASFIQGGAPADADEAPPGCGTELADWTILLYLNGNNASMDRALSRIALPAPPSAAPREPVNIVVQWASLCAKTTWRFRMGHRDEIERVGGGLGRGPDMGDWRTLRNFIVEGACRYPARHYLVVIASHGSGIFAGGSHPTVPTKDGGPSAPPACTPVGDWVHRKCDEDERKEERAEGLLPASRSLLSVGSRSGRETEAISFDDRTLNAMTVQELGKAFDAARSYLGRPIDIVGSDACLMGMVEVGSELRRSVDYYVGSQGREVLAGWPYCDWLNKLIEAEVARPERPAAPLEVGKLLVDSYAANVDRMGDLAAWELSALPRLEGSLRSLSSAVQGLDEAGRELVHVKIRRAFASTPKGFVDLGTLMTTLKQTRLAVPATRVEAARKVVVVKQVKTPRNKERGARRPDDGRRFTGVSIWLPRGLGGYRNREHDYGKLVFDQQTGWGKAAERLATDNRTISCAWCDW